MATNILTQSVLVESQSARDTALANTTNDQAFDVMDKAKALVMALWKGENLATVEQISDYYEVGIEAIKSIIRRNESEILMNGARKLAGEEIRDARVSLTLPQKASHAWVFTPRSALCVGLMLTESKIATAVRTILLDIATATPAQRAESENLRLQNENLKLEVKKLELQLQVSQSQQSLLASVHLLEAVSPGLAPLALGKVDSVVTRIEKIERIIAPNGQAYEGVGITYLAKLFGFSDNKKAWAWLESIGFGKLSGKWESQISAIEQLKLPVEVFEELIVKFGNKEGTRQLFLCE